MQPNAVFLALFGLVAFALAYRFYARYLARHVFGLDPSRPTPARTREDGVDYVPTDRHVLFGHHFTSVAGAAPILGPAIAVIWGWLPALLWVVFGAIFMGAVHDFGCLFVSTRNGGTTIADLTGRIVGPRARILFLLLVFFLAWIVIAVFAVAIGGLFVAFPGTVLPINAEILVAVVIGFVLHRLRWRLLWPSLGALVLLYALVWVGAEYTSDFVMPTLPGLAADRTGQVQTWVVLLLGYAFVASVLPVWLLLQPRDYINSHQLFVGLGAMYLGLFLLRPPVVAPAVNLADVGGQSWFPLLFITIACGAISGFHGLVASGTTSKQVASEADTKAIGYGGMLGEGCLALMAVIACSAGFESVQAWNGHYESFQGIAGSSSGQMGAFVKGAGRFLHLGVGLPEGFSQVVVAVIVISFAATTLDTATRIQRFILEEIGATYSLRPLRNRYLSSAVAAFLPLVLVFGKREVDGQPKEYWKDLWPIFGATNQMLGGLCLLVLSVYLLRRGRRSWALLAPTALLSGLTSYAMLVNLLAYLRQEAWLLVGLSVVLLTLAAWIFLEGLLTWRRLRGLSPAELRGDLE